MIVIDLHLEIFALLYILILCITLLIYKLKKKNKYNIYGLILFELYILCLVKVVYTPVRIVFNRAMSDDMVEKMKMITQISYHLGPLRESEACIILLYRWEETFSY